MWHSEDGADEQWLCCEDFKKLLKKEGVLGSDVCKIELNLKIDIRFFLPDDNSFGSFGFSICVFWVFNLYFMGFYTAYQHHVAPHAGVQYWDLWRLDNHRYLL